MQHCQLTRDKFNSELRQQGYISLAKVFAVTLEPPGKVAVITQSEPATAAPTAFSDALLALFQSLRQRPGRPLGLTPAISTSYQATGTDSHGGCHVQSLN
jgi:hypothetical protein